MVIPLSEGELVQLIDRKERRYQLVLRAGSTFNFRYGAVAHDTILGKVEGSIVHTTYGEKLLVLRPTLAEYIDKMRKGSQIIYPKDIGPILLLADLFPGATVVEAGIGSGALTLALLRTVGSGGRVISYERRPEFLEVARGNIETFFGAVTTAGRAGMGELQIKEQDVYEGIEETDVDRILLDLTEPWRAVKHAETALRPGGILLCYNPTVLQIYKLTRRLDLKYPETFRVMGIYEFGQRRWEIKGRSVRPELRMVAHTGFMVVVRRTAGTA